MRVTIDNFQHMPMILEFVRFTDWFAEDESVIVIPISTNNYSFNVTNPGTGQIHAVVTELDANAAGGFAQPQVTNLSNGHIWASTRTAQSGNSILRIDAGKYQARYSNDNGDTWVDDYGLITMADTQVAFMRLEPGDNNMRYLSQSGGTPNLTLTMRFYPVFE